MNWIDTRQSFSRNPCNIALNCVQASAVAAEPAVPNLRKNMNRKIVSRRDRKHDLGRYLSDEEEQH